MSDHPPFPAPGDPNGRLPGKGPSDSSSEGPTSDDAWAVALTWIARELDRDLQAPSRQLGGPRKLWEASAERVQRAFHRSPGMGDRFLAARRTVRGRRVTDELDTHGVWVAAPGTEGSLSCLTALPDPPFALLGRGAPLASLLHSGRPLVAIVGSRRPTAFGLQFTTDLAADLAGRGAIVVSGLALGIDAAAHRGALMANAPTVAVLGCGVDVEHPRTNAGLRRSILAGGGTVVAEYWPDTPPARWRFPARNRIVAGLADAVVVTEAAARSGALITADFALELGRPVLAVPGRPGAPTSAGCHTLLRSGAAFCESADDVVAELPNAGWIDGVPGCDPDPLDGLAGQIVELLMADPQTLPQLADALGGDASVLAAELAHLEIRGVIAPLDGQRYRVTRSAAAPSTAALRSSTAGSTGAAEPCGEVPPVHGSLDDGGVP